MFVEKTSSWKILFSIFFVIYFILSFIFHCVGNNKKKQCDVSNWRLFQDYNNLEAERRTATERVEAKRRAECLARINALTDEQRILNGELANLKGLFSGSRRKEINTRLLEIEKEMKKLK